MQVHFPPRYDAGGRLLPPGKGSGLKSFPQLDRRDECSTWNDFSNQERKRKFESRSAMIAHRKSADAIQMQIFESRLERDFKAELGSSNQVAEALKSPAGELESGTGNSRLKLLQSRKEETLKVSRALRESWKPAEEKISEIFMKSPPKVLTPFAKAVVLPKKRNEEDHEIFQTRAKTSHARIRLLPLEKEINRHPPNAPGLNWVKNPELGKSMREIEVQQRPITQHLRRPRRREPGPLAHFTIDHHDFGASLREQYPGVQSREGLFEARKECFIRRMNQTKDASDFKKGAEIASVTEPLRQSNEPWWEIKRSESDMALIKTKQAKMREDFERKTYAISQNPAESGEFKGLALELKLEKRLVADKIAVPETRLEHGLNLHKKSFGFSRKTKDTRFTDVVIEFRKKLELEELDLNGKKPRFEPGERRPLYSSFTSDSIFLGKEERSRVTAALQERERINLLPRRSFVITKTTSTPNLLRRSSTCRSIATVHSHPPSVIIGGQNQPGKVRSSAFGAI